MSSRWARITLTALALTLPAAAAQAGDDPRHVLVTDPGPGAATRYHVGLPYKPLTKPRRLAVGEKIRCSQGCRLVVDDGSSLVLSPGAVLEASSPRFVRFHENRMAHRCQVVTLLEGGMRVERAAHSTTLLVDARQGATAAVHSGNARVRAIPDGMVVVPSGDAALKRGHAWTTLTPGRAYRVLRNQVSERLAVAAPTWSADGPDQRPIALAVSGPIGVVQAGWQPVVGAVSYTVEIASDPTFAVVVKELVVESPQFQTALSEGRYWARVTSVDEDGMDAPSSLPRALRVVRVALPHSAFMPEPGTLVVPQQGVLRILDTEGIELSVDKSGFWPAPHVLHGPTRAFHRLRLRLVGDPRSTTMVRLERRALHAWVSMTPAPSWPSDPVQVAVRLDDPSGRIEPSSVEPALEVLLAGKPIETIWERDGNVWRTHIRGRVLDAPSLLEVVARDDAGIPLGWGFLELVGGGRVSHSDR